MYKQRQVKCSKCLEGLLFYGEVVERSLKVKVQFPRHPILKSAKLIA